MGVVCGQIGWGLAAQAPAAGSVRRVAATAQHAVEKAGGDFLHAWQVQQGVGGVWDDGDEGLGVAFERLGAGAARLRVAQPGVGR